MDHRCVIAGCGYVGRRLAARAQSSWQVVGLTRAPATVVDLRVAGIEAIGVDFDSDQAVPALRGLADGAAVAYLAPPPNHGTTDPRLERFLGLLADARPTVLLYMSTTGVYGDAAGAAVNEASPAIPTSDRSRRRLAAENVAKSWSEACGARCVILRVPGIYGPHRLPLERLHRGEPALRPEDSGSGNRIHVDDLVECCIAAIERPVHGVFNVGDGDHASTTEFLQKVAALAGLQSPRLVSLAEAQGQISPGMLEYLVESRRVLTTRMHEELGVVPRYGILESGIAASLAEMRIR